MRQHLSVVPGQEHDTGAPISSALQTLDLLSSEGDHDLQEIVDLVQSACGVKYAAVSILDGPEYYLSVTAGIAPFVCDAQDTLCVHTMDCHYGVFIENAAVDERFLHSPYVNGTLMSLRFYASAPIYGPDGTMIGRLCVFDDEPKVMTPLQERTLTTLASNISGVLELRLRQHEDEIREARHQAASEEVLRVAAQISHDMRIPLTALVTSLEMLQESNPPDMDPVRARVLAGARRSADRLAKLVDGIMRLHDVDRDHSVGLVHLGRTVQQVVTDTGPLLQQTRASVHIGELPRLQADPDQMYSLILNLVTNAVKFSRPGVPPDIRFSSARTEDGWRISVRDNGIGIPPEKREQVFVMFTRLNTAVEGNGIGLATVARIVQAHGGRAGITEFDGPGTEIWFELPERPRAVGTAPRSKQ